MWSVVMLSPTFKNPDDCGALRQGDNLALRGIHAGMDAGCVTLEDVTTGKAFELVCDFTERQKAMLKAGGLLAFTATSD